MRGVLTLNVFLESKNFLSIFLCTDVPIQTNLFQSNCSFKTKRKDKPTDDKLLNLYMLSITTQADEDF